MRLAGKASVPNGGPFIVVLPADGPFIFSPLVHMTSAVELTTFSRRRVMHTVYETKGVSPYIGCLGFIRLGFGFGSGFGFRFGYIFIYNL